MKASFDPTAIPKDHRSGYAALIGKPNVGKSTLMNALVGRKLSIVTDKPQTTRHRVLGIHSEEKHQVIFLDTPGIINPRYALQQSMMRSVDTAVSEADLLLFLADATRRRPDEMSLQRIEGRPALLVLTKMDRLAQQEALPLVDEYLALRAFEDVIPTSAVEGTNLDVLMSEIAKRLPEGPPFYPKDQVSEHPERFFVAEIVREKVFQQFREEIPYSTQVNITAFDAHEGKRKTLIDAEVVVSKSSQKGILIGKGGRAIKQVGAAARKDIEELLGTGVYLQLHVKVREGWREKPAFLRSYGYQT